MRKSKILKHFRRMPETDKKEKFMRENSIAFAYDNHGNMTVWADDGTLRLFPLDR